MAASCEAHSVIQMKLAICRKRKTRYPMKCDRKVNLPVDQHSIGNNNEMWAIVSFKLHQISNQCHNLIVIETQNNKANIKFP